ncbi:hypothetical protein F5887DRAFT_18265 [Amanita rubescens]|nr:hypothetical protein F5887DRAFT_18265 [Amanita rubescens]
MPPKVFCSICKEDYELENIRVLLCGHGYCILCDPRTKMCPACRRPKSLDQSIRLYLTFVDDLAPEERTQNAIDRLSKFSAKAPGEKMKALEELLRATVDQSNGEQLTSVIRNIGEFILQPMSTELDHSKEECCKLRDQLKQAENTEILVDDLRIQLQRVKKERQEVKATCRALQDKLDSSEADKLRLSRRIDRVKSERDQANAERQRLEVQFAEQGQLKRKLRAVVKATRRTQPDDDSLLVEAPKAGQGERHSAGTDI